MDSAYQSEREGFVEGKSGGETVVSKPIARDIEQTF